MENVLQTHKGQRKYSRTNTICQEERKDRGRKEEGRKILRRNVVIICPSKICVTTAVGDGVFVCLDSVSVVNYTGKLWGHELIDLATCTRGSKICSCSSPPDLFLLSE